MTRSARILLALLFLAALVAVPRPALAQGKIRIAIWDFQNNAANNGWSWYDKLGPAARDDIDTAIGEDNDLSSKFTVIERDKLELVMKEQGLGQSGAVDPQTAAKVGKILGVRFVVTGAVDKFAISTTRGGIGGIGGSKTTASCTINIRFIDTNTAERVAALSADGSISKGGGFVGSANLSTSEQFGIASDAIQKASKDIVAKLAKIDAITKLNASQGSTGGIDARVARVDGKQIYLNIGASSGVKVGEKFSIFEAGEPIIDPATGANLGSSEKRTGTCTVTDVQDKFSIATLDGASTASVKSIVRR
jgi:curli biogenesis system outer membrane secretion channel CsgG